MGAPSSATPNAVVPTLDELFDTEPDQFVTKYADIAAVNLACARGLPKCDESEFPKYLALLDTMADAVRRHTERSWRLFKIKPTEFHNSENVFRVFMMEHVLRMQFGVKYDPLVTELTNHGTKYDAWNSDDSSELFIHGVLSEKRTGTCSSLPTFSIAVGRRLGYPLKLIRVPHHTLFRWDDGKEKFNHQHTDAGGAIYPDEYFHTWPKVWNADMFAMNARTKVWLHSMTPRQEVSKFLCNRALLLRDVGRFSEALEVIAAAGKFDAANPACAEITFDIQEKMNLAVHSSYVRISSMPIEPSPDQLLDTLSPVRERSNDPKHLAVRITRIGNQSVEGAERSIFRMYANRKEQTR